MQIQWKQLARTEAVRALEGINPKMGNDALPAGSTKVRMASLPFYKNFRIFEMTDTRHNPPRSFYCLHSDISGMDGTYFLDFTNRPIYAVNEVAPIALNRDNVIPYVGFFFASVQGEFGPMTVIEKLDLPDDIPEKDQAEVEELKKLAPPSVASIDAKGNYNISAAMLFHECIFATNIEVTPAGLLRVTDHRLVFAGGDPAQMEELAKKVEQMEKEGLLPAGLVPPSLDGLPKPANDGGDLPGWPGGAPGGASGGTPGGASTKPGGRRRH